MFGLETPDFLAMQVRSETLGKQPLDGAVLAQLAGPTESDPFQFMGITWMVGEQSWPLSVVVRPRDFIVVSATGTVSRPNGERIGYEVVQSIDLPQCPQLPNPMIRGKLMYGAIYRQLGNGTVDVYIRMYVETQGRILDKLVIAAMWESPLGFWNAPRLSETKKLQWCIENKSVKRREQASALAHNRSIDPGHCDNCLKKRNFLSRRRSLHLSDESTCALCSTPLCSSCRVKKTLKAAGERSGKLLDTQVAVCQACMLFAQKQCPVTIAQRTQKHRQTVNDHSRSGSWRLTQESTLDQPTFSPLGSALRYPSISMSDLVKLINCEAMKISLQVYCICQFPTEMQLSDFHVGGTSDSSFALYRNGINRSFATMLSLLRHPANFRSVHVLAAGMSSLSERFERSLALGKTLPPLSDNAAKLEMYALFKQANLGANTMSRPGMLDFVGRAKWDAWTKLGNMTQDDAKLKYIAIIDELAAKNGTAEEDEETVAASSGSEDLLVEISEAGLLTIQLNRPKKFNAIDIAMYEGLTKALESSKTQDKVKAVLLKSTGDYFSSGNDMSMFTSNPDGLSLEALAEKGAVLLEDVVNTFITYPKPIVAAVQGPAVGIATTILALCDLVYVKETATFHTPFTSLGQSPEACSSLLFPRIMGPARANAMLLLGEKMSAKDALETGFATAVFGAAEFDTQVQSKVVLLLSRYPQSMQRSKALIRSPATVKEL